MSEASSTPDARPAGRIRRALPPFWTALIGAEIWAALMAASAFLGLWRLEWQTPDRIQQVLKLFALGGFAAFPLGYFAAAFLAGRRRAQTRFAAAFLGFTLATIGATALIFGLLYRVYYSEWHDDHLSVRLMFEIGFTVAAAIYQFAVLGLRLYFPLGFAALFCLSLWFARRES